MEAMPETIKGEQLTVTAQVLGGSLVAYDVLAKESGNKIMRTRFSDLNAFHTKLLKEVPSFKGVLPAKTFSRKTSADFVESRRKGIEAYLRLAATNGLTRKSSALRSFLPAWYVE